MKALTEVVRRVRHKMSAPASTPLLIAAIGLVLLILCADLLWSALA